jgi:predicted enzyme related to lactoylglutathione lyase
MANGNGSARGRFVWHDLQTTDVEAAAAFYASVIGWGRQSGGGVPGRCATWTARGNVVGGVTRLPTYAADAPRWLTYVYTPDVAATASRAESLGGRVLAPPSEAAGGGAAAVIEDPQGVVFAAVTPARAVGAHDGPVGEGEFSWHELVTTDYRDAFAFYRELFGWESTGQFDLGALGVYYLYGRNGVSLGGMFNRDTAPAAPVGWLPHARVADARIAAERVRARGGRVLQEPAEVPGGDWVALCTDPQGGAFALHQVKHP